MSAPSFTFADPDQVRAYVEHGPPAFMPGHGGVLQMIAVLLAERIPADGEVLVVGAGGGLETRYLAEAEPGWRFTGVDPAPEMLDLARAIAGPAAGDRLTLIDGSVADAPDGPFDAATCVLVLGLLADDGGKLALLRRTRTRLKQGAPFILIDQCFASGANDAETRIERYAEYARRSGVGDDVVTRAVGNLRASTTIVPADRDEQLLDEAGFTGRELFYVGMAWRGWVAYA